MAKNIIRNADFKYIFSAKLNIKLHKMVVESDSYYVRLYKEAIYGVTY